MSHHFCRSVVLVWFSWVLGSGFQKLQSRYWMDCFSSGGSNWEEPISKIIQAIGRIYFLVALWLSCCWLLTGGYPQVLEKLYTVLEFVYHYVCVESLKVGHLSATYYMTSVKSIYFWVGLHPVSLFWLKLALEVHLKCQFDPVELIVVKRKKLIIIGVMLNEGR